MTSRKRGPSDEDGIAMVEAEFGANVAAHIRSAPQRLFNESMAEFGSDEMAKASREDGEAYVRRCERDEDFARRQAETIRHTVDVGDRGRVPTVGQIRRGVQDREQKAQGWYAARAVRYTPKFPLDAL